MKLFAILFVFAAGLFAQATHSITLTWTDPNNPSGTQYNVYKLAAVCPSAPPATVAAAVAAGFAKLNSAPAISLTLTDAAVMLGTSYCYVVTATNGTAESNPSPQAGATVLPFSPASLTIAAK